MKKALRTVCLLLSVPVVLLNADALEKVRKAPDLSFILSNDAQETLAQYRGKVVALEFIYTTCPHCKAASHLMSKLQTEYGGRGFQVIDVAVNLNADLLIDGFAKDQQVNFPVAWTTSAQMMKFMGFADGRFVVPQLVLIDRAGNIHWQTPALSGQGDDWEKLMSETAIREHVEQLLSQPANAQSARASSAPSAH